MPAVVITTGEPSGIGVEVTLKALLQDFPANIIVLGDFDHIASINQRANLGLKLKSIAQVSECAPHKAGEVTILSRPLPSVAKLGHPNKTHAHYVLELLSSAHHLAQSGAVDAIVTAPVHKGIINDAGTPFSGHTEFFAEHSNVERVVMMLASEPMRVALMTTHLPLRQVPDAISETQIHQVLSICVRGLQQLGIDVPKIKVCGLNPHAGEQGHLGREELDIITPALRSFSQAFVELANSSDISGPYPADTLFSNSNLNTTDLFLGMYHDQVLPVIKYASFGACANVTLGLPYLRTSVDHGTGLDIADQFIADSGSMEYAIQFALKAIQSKQRTS